MLIPSGHAQGNTPVVQERLELPCSLPSPRRARQRKSRTGRNKALGVDLAVFDDIKHRQRQLAAILSW